MTSTKRAIKIFIESVDQKAEQLGELILPKDPNADYSRFPHEMTKAIDHFREMKFWLNEYRIKELAKAEQANYCESGVCPTK